jgi:hypothetical protein
MSEQEGLRFLAAEAQDCVISKQTTSGGPYAVGIGRSSVDGRAARWLQARARHAIHTLTTRSGSCDHA